MEAFGLVFVERVALAIASEVDHLPEVLKRDEMLAPEVIECLQQHHLLDLAHRLGAELLLLGLGLLSHGLEQPLGYFLIGDPLFGSPALDRQIKTKNATDLLLQLRRVPLLGVDIGGDQFTASLPDPLRP